MQICTFAQGNMEEFKFVLAKIQTSKKFDDQFKNEIKEDMKKLEKTVIETMYERQMIVNAMGKEIKLGAWHKCPNGHIYAIGDCGGAMESRKFPECSATIGGSNHRLTSGNTVAREMDGATRSAWPQ